VHLENYGIFAVTNYLGVDLEKHKRVEIPKENIILTVGVLQPHKAHDFVIRSFGLVLPTKRSKFVIITSGYSNNPLYKEKL
jgi:glycosyltransferase involved in cell wall biosynthesis